VPLSLTVSLPGTILDTNGEIDEVNGEVSWDFYSGAAMIEDLVLTAISGVSTQASKPSSAQRRRLRGDPMRRARRGEDAALATRRHGRLAGPERRIAPLRPQRLEKAVGRETAGRQPVR
jgi:hypothetical protein